MKNDQKEYLRFLHEKYPDDENPSNHNHITWRLVDVYYVSLSQAKDIHLKFHKSDLKVKGDSEDNARIKSD